MDIKEIEQMPEFKHDIDAVTWSKLSESDRHLAEALSVSRQELRWVCEKTIIAHNLAVQTYAKLSKFILWLLSTIGLVILEEIVRRNFMPQ